MSMKEAFKNNCKTKPEPYNPIKKDTEAPYGNGVGQSENMDVSELIKTLQEKRSVGVIHHIDVWGEGNKNSERMFTGFRKSFNININQGITGDPQYKYYGYPIPNLLPVCLYNDTFDMIPDKSVRYLTMMGAPADVGKILDEMKRILIEDGAVITYGYSLAELNMLQDKLYDISFSRAGIYNLSKDFGDISLNPVYVFTKNGKYINIY